jgi:hypothetical protein
VDVFAFRQRLVQRHAKEIHTVVKSANEEVHLQATKCVI